MSTRADVLVNGLWRPSSGGDSFKSVNPDSGAAGGAYPISPWEELAECLMAGAAAYEAMVDLPVEAIANFLEQFASRVEDRSVELVEIAHVETALPVSPRLTDIELPRMVDQLRQAAAAARARTWKRPVISSVARVASLYEAVPGVVCVFGPNNFPFAFNSIGGGDFASAVATGHPIIGKANPGHPETTRLLAEEADLAAGESGLPSGFIQLVYRTTHADGARLVADPRLAATAYTGSRGAGLALKSAADATGNLIYLEMSSINPVVVLPGAWAERGSELAAELVGSMLLGVGQFCTSPGLLLVQDGPEIGAIRDDLKAELENAPSGTLLGEGVVAGLEQVAEHWLAAGAGVVGSAAPATQSVCVFPNSMMEVGGKDFLAQPDALQAEAFGNLSLLVVCSDLDELIQCLGVVEGNLTGSIYSAQDGSDDLAYAAISPVLRQRVGRLLNDKPPTGVAVVAGMNHGGPYPSTGHPGFTAVGIPASLERFGMLQCYDNVRDDRLPPELQAANPLGMARSVDGEVTSDAVAWG